MNASQFSSELLPKLIPWLKRKLAEHARYEVYSFVLRQVKGAIHRGTFGPHVRQYLIDHPVAGPLILITALNAALIALGKQEHFEDIN